MSELDELYTKLIKAIADYCTAVDDFDRIRAQQVIENLNEMIKLIEKEGE